MLTSIVRNIALISLSVIACISTLLLTTNPDIRYTQDFYRILPQNPVKPLTIIQTTNTELYLAGLTNNTVYLAKLNSPDSLLSYNLKNNELSKEKISFPMSQKTDLTSGTTIEVDNNVLLIKDSYHKKLYRGTIQSLFVQEIVESPAYFTQAVQMTDSIFALQTVVSNKDNTQQRTILALLNSGASALHIEPNALEAQIDEYFSTMGTLCFSAKISKLIYTYSYRNKFTIFDTAMHIVAEGNTIDSISTARINPVHINDSTLSLASPSTVVNLGSAVDDNYLFVHSNLQGSNEIRLTFDHSTVIDVYTVSDQKYVSSFYIPNFENEKTKSFLVRGNVLAARYSSAIIIYDISTIFSDTR